MDVERWIFVGISLRDVAISVANSHHGMTDGSSLSSNESSYRTMKDEPALSFIQCKLEVQTQVCHTMMVVSD